MGWLLQGVASHRNELRLWNLVSSQLKGCTHVSMLPESRHTRSRVIRVPTQQFWNVLHVCFVSYKFIFCDGHFSIIDSRHTLNVHGRTQEHDQRLHAIVAWIQYTKNREVWVHTELVQVPVGLIWHPLWPSEGVYNPSIELSSPMYGTFQVPWLLAVTHCWFTNSHVRNSQQFAQFVITQKVPDTKDFVSFDAVICFTREPTSCAIQIICDQLMNVPSIPDRTTLPKDTSTPCSNFAWRPPTWPLRARYTSRSMVANLVMEDVEQDILSTFHTPPQFWRRYMDDTCTALSSNLVNSFNNNLNSIDPCISSRWRMSWMDSSPYLTSFWAEKKMAILYITSPLTQTNIWVFNNTTLHPQTSRHPPYIANPQPSSISRCSVDQQCKKSPYYVGQFSEPE